MTPQEHAKVWREAARVVAGMDPRQQMLQQHAARLQQAGQLHETMGGVFYGGGSSYGAEEAAAWRAYSAAAGVLTAIAAEYEKATSSD